MSTEGEQLLRIGEFAQLVGKSTRTLRLYEERGLLEPTHRSPGGFRLYLHAQKERLLVIERLQRLGLSLSEIRTLLGRWASADKPSTAMETLHTRYRAELERIRQLRAELSVLERELEENLSFLAGCLPCVDEAPPETACTHCARREARRELTLIDGIAEPHSASADLCAEPT